MHIVIIGNGIAGITAARFIRKRSDYKVSIISAESDYFFSRTALMYIYMGHMRFKDTKPYEDWFWKKNKLNLIRGYVHDVDLASKKLNIQPCTQDSVHGNPPDEIHYDKLVIATGSSPNKFDWPGQDLDGVTGMYDLRDLESIEKYTTDINRAVLVGGGLIGIELAEMLHSRNIPVSFLVRESSFWNKVLPPQESEMINRHIREHGIDLRLNTELDRIVGDGTGRCSGVTTGEKEDIPCEFVGLTAGVRPNIGFLQSSGLDIGKGILVNEYLETNFPDVYAIGDCAEVVDPQPGRRSIEAVWYVGKIMGETLAYSLTGQRTAYRPGMWFNSAKFFDIEYQVYGDIQSTLPASQESIYFEDDNGKRSIRINYDKRSEKVVGFNLMGVRYRHEVCRKWIEDGSKIDTVLKNLKLANFDPEFFSMMEGDIRRTYMRKCGKSTSESSTRSWAAVRAFLKS